MNAIELLKADHRTVRKLLDELADTSVRATKARPELLAQIERELSAHTRIEEEIFYPAFRKAGGGEEATMYHEAREEHRAVEKLVLPDLKETDPASHEFSGRAKVLKELVEHHADEEEEEMFADAEKLLSADRLAALGAQMEARKRELLQG
ncbi:MAG: hemerythrin domain-containing protein [Sneathiellaceae bacterium]